MQICRDSRNAAKQPVEQSSVLQWAVDELSCQATYQSPGCLNAGALRCNRPIPYTGAQGVRLDHVFLERHPGSNCILSAHRPKLQLDPCPNPRSNLNLFTALDQQGEPNGGFAFLFPRPSVAILCAFGPSLSSREEPPIVAVGSESPRMFCDCLPTIRPKI